MEGHGLSLPALEETIHVALAMLKAPKRGNLVHQRKAGNHRRSIAMEIEREDIPCYEVTVKVVVTGLSIERAEEHISEALRSMKYDNDCEIFDWDFVDWEEA